MRSLLIVLFLSLPVHSQVYKLKGTATQKLNGREVTAEYRGTAVCILSRGGRSYLLTATHCVERGVVVSVEGAACEVLGTDPLYDIALIECPVPLESMEIEETLPGEGEEVSAVGIVGAAESPSTRPNRVTQAGDNLIVYGDQVEGGMSGGVIKWRGKLAGIIGSKIGDHHSMATGVGPIRRLIARFSEGE